jgi:hypothetical protein
MNDPVPHICRRKRWAPADMWVIRDDNDARMRALLTETTDSGAAS